MSVHTLGVTTAPSWGWNAVDSYNEIANTAQQNMPYTGYVSDVFVYFGANSGSISAQICLFDGMYGLIGASPTFSVSGQAWQRWHLASPVLKGAGNSVGAGFFSTGYMYFSIYSSGSWRASTSSTPTGGYNNWPAPGSPFTQGGLGYYFYWLDPVSLGAPTPSIAAAGQDVTISSWGLTGGVINSVTFAGITLYSGTGPGSYSINSDSQLRVTLPSNSPGGPQALAIYTDHGQSSTTITVSSAYLTRSGSEVSSQGVYVIRTGSPSMSQGVLRFKNGSWVNGQ